MGTAWMMPKRMGCSHWRKALQKNMRRVSFKTSQAVWVFLKILTHHLWHLHDMPSGLLMPSRRYLVTISSIPLQLKDDSSFAEQGWEHSWWLSSWLEFVHIQEMWSEGRRNHARDSRQVGRPHQQRDPESILLRGDMRYRPDLETFTPQLLAIHKVSWKPFSNFKEAFCSCLSIFI